MRVLLVAAHLGKGGGVALQAVQLLKELRRRIDVELVCLDAPGPHQALTREPGVEVAGPLVFPKGIVTLSRVLRAYRRRYDIFQLYDAYFTYPAAYLARVFPRIAYLGTDPGVEITLRYGAGAGAFTRAILVPLLSGSAVVTNSQFLASRFRPYRPRVIPNGLDIQPFERLPTREEARSRQGIPGDRTLLATVGKVIPEKRTDWIMEVVRRLPQTAAVLVGGFTEERYGDRYYRQLLATYEDVRDRVRFPGEVPWDQVLLYLAAADVFVFPSQFEGSPNAVLEAMAAGLPVVASDIPAHREIIEPGRTGFLAGDPESMTRCVETLAGDPQLRHDVGSHGRTYVREHFGSEAVALKYLDLYRSILGS